MTDRKTKTEFDALLCHTQNARDRQYAYDLCETLENRPYNYKIFLPERDLKDDMDRLTLSRIIEHRCNKVIVILSEDFMNDVTADYVLRFTVGTSPNCRNGKLIPVSMENFALPEFIRHLSVCDYTRVEMRPYLTSRIAKAIEQRSRVPNKRRQTRLPP